jgi:hypothetical protein
MLELGDQLISVTEGILTEITGKEYFLRKGYEHTPVDINGLNGSVMRDLSQPEEFDDWHTTFDIVTNCGTTEHVEPFESQYDCFNIIHDVLKIGGIAIHLVPDVYELDNNCRRKNHCRYYYSDELFRSLSESNGYKLLSCTVIGGLRCAVIKKIKEAPFMLDRSNLLSLIAIRPYSINIFVKMLRVVGIGKLLRLIGKRFPLLHYKIIRSNLRKFTHTWFH